LIFITSFYTGLSGIHNYVQGLISYHYITITYLQPLNNG